MKPTQAESFRLFAAELVSQSKEVFVKDGTHGEMFFLIAENGQGTIMPIVKSVDRDDLVAVLKQRIQQENIFGIVHIAESWSYFPRGEHDHTMKQLALGEIKVAELTPGDRRE